MNRYTINLKFKKKGDLLNEHIIKILNIELKRYFYKKKGLINYNEYEL